MAVIGRLSDFGVNDKERPGWNKIREVQVAVADSYAEINMLRLFWIADRNRLPIHPDATRLVTMSLKRLNGKLREDGRLVRDMYLFQVKSPAESKGKDDIYKLIATVPGDQAYRPLAESACPFVKK